MFINAFSDTIYVLIWHNTVGGSLFITTLYCAYGHPTFPVVFSPNLQPVAIINIIPEYGRMSIYEKFQPSFYTYCLIRGGISYS